MNPIKLQVSATIKMFKSRTKLQLQKHMNLNYKLKYLNLELKWNQNKLSNFNKKTWKYNKPVDPCNSQTYQLRSSKNIIAYLSPGAYGI